MDFPSLPYCPPPDSLFLLLWNPIPLKDVFQVMYLAHSVCQARKELDNERQETDSVLGCSQANRNRLQLHMREPVMEGSLECYEHTEEELFTH